MVDTSILVDTSRIHTLILHHKPGFKGSLPPQKKEYCHYSDIMTERREVRTNTMLPGSIMQPSLLVSENSLHLGLSCLVMMP